jgi:hypothetical protein
MSDELLYTKQEVLEIVRQVLFYGDPDFWEQGGVTGAINFPRNGTYRKAEEYFEKYYNKTKPNNNS